MEGLRTMNSLKLFEKKLDKIQDEVIGHGNMLGDLKVMLATLTDATIGSPNGTTHAKFPIRRSIASQYEDIPSKTASTKFKKKNPNLPLQSLQEKQSKMKTLEIKKNESKMDKKSSRGRRGTPKQNIIKKTLKGLSRQKVDSTRKITATVRTAKIIDKRMARK